MYARLLATCAALCVAPVSAETPTLATTSASDAVNKFLNGRNQSFLNVIKEKLRRNNDDYEVDEYFPSPKLAPPDTRRMLNDSEQDESVPDTPIIHVTKLRAKDVPRKKKHEHHSVKAHTIHKEKTNNTNQKIAVNRWKSPLNKKNLHMHAGTTKPVPQVLRNELRTDSVETAMAPMILSDPSETPLVTKPAIYTATRRTAASVAAADLYAVRPQEVIRKPPSADQLDMAPARGAYVHNLRLKGKLCHRHVLWPEGPKYNSKGETIMPAFNRSLYHRRSFFETSKPMYVLPHCCNCCRKSVLGCQ